MNEIKNVNSPYIKWLENEGTNDIAKCTEFWHAGETCFEYKISRTIKLTKFASKFMLIGLVIPQLFLKWKRLMNEPIPTLKSIFKQYLRSCIYIALCSIIPFPAACHLIQMRGMKFEYFGNVFICFSLGMLAFFFEPI